MNSTQKALIFFLLFSLIATYPLVTHLNWVSSKPDESIYLWMMWWYKEQLTSFQNPVYTNHWCYPTGLYMWFQNMTPLNSTLSIFLQQFLQIEVVFNLLMLFSFVTSGFFMYLFVKKISESNYAGVISGVIYSFSTARFIFYRWAEINLISMQWIPLSLYFQLKAIKEKKHRYIALTGLSIGFTGLAHWEYLPSHVVIITFFTGFYLLQDRLTWRAYVKNYVVAGIIAFLITSPFLIPMLLETRSHDYMFLKKEEIGDAAGPFPADLSSIILPPPEHLLFKDITKKSYENFQFFPGSDYVYIGMVAIILSLIGLSKRKEILFLIIFTCFFILISAGPYLEFQGQKLSPNPIYTLYRKIPLIGIGRTPLRNVLFAQFSIAILAGFGIKKILGKIKNKKLHSAITLFLTVLILIDSHTTLEFQKPYDHEPFKNLKDIKGSSLHLPYYRYQSLYASLLHEKPMLNCILPRGRIELNHSIRLRDLRKTLPRIHNPQQMTEEEMKNHSITDQTLLENYNVTIITFEEKKMSREESAALKKYLKLMGYHEHAQNKELGIYVKN